jgi:hypothetical protein
MNVIITCFFWFLLYDAMKKIPHYANNPTQMLGLVLHHSLPLIMLSADYLINAMPIVQRHICAILPMCGVYLLLNFYVTVSRGKPVYGIMSWDSPIGFAIPFGTLLAGVLIFTVFRIVN